jgi:hypothetical protein
MRKITRVRAGLALAATALASLGPAGSATAQDLAGETVEYVIPFSESGGSAAWANFYAPLISEALPGKPTVVVRYRPGAGSTEGANWFQENQGSGDGLLIFGDSGSTKFPYLLGDPRVRYEYKDWKPVLASGTGGVVYLPPDLAERFDGDVDDLKDVSFLYGSQGATSLDLVPLLSFKMLGLTVSTTRPRPPTSITFSRWSTRASRCRSSPGALSTRAATSSAIRPSRTSRPSRKCARPRKAAKPPAQRGTPGRRSSSPASPTRRPSSCPAVRRRR